MSKETLQIAEKREVIGKGERERYTQLNAEFQRMAKRGKKAFLSKQCEETEENNRMGKISDLFKKIRDIKGTFHVRIGMIKDRDGKDLIETEEAAIMQRAIEKKKKGPNNPNNHDSMIVHLETDILEYKVK